MKERVQNYLRYLLGGILCSFCANAIDICLIFQDSIMWVYLYLLFIVIVVSCIIAFIVRPRKIFEFFVSIIAVIIGIYVFEIILYVLDIYRWFYFIENPNSTEVAIGNSLATLCVWISEAIGLVVGFIFGFVRNIIIRKRKSHNR